MTLANVPDSKLNGVLTFRNALDDIPKQLEKVTETKDKKEGKKKKTKYYPVTQTFRKLLLSLSSLLQTPIQYSLRKYIGKLFSLKKI